MVKNLSAMPETWVQSLGWEDPLEKGTGYPLQCSGLEKAMESQRVRHNWVNFTFIFNFRKYLAIISSTSFSFSYEILIIHSGHWCYLTVNGDSAVFLPICLCAFQFNLYWPILQFGLSQGLSGKESSCNAGNAEDVDLIPELARSPGRGHGNPLQYSCLEDPMDRGAWRVTVHRVTKSQTDLKWRNKHTHKIIITNFYWMFTLY